MTPVEHAAQILDRKTPGWANKIDLDVLNLHSLQVCVLGQVYGSYHFPDACAVVRALQHASEHLTPLVVFYENEFLPEWRRAITARTEQVFVPAEWEKETVPA